MIKQRKVDFKNDDLSTDWTFGMIEPEDPGFVILTKKKRYFLLFFVLFFFLVSFIFIFRMIQLNFFMSNDTFRTQAETNYKRVFKERALRGIFYDRNGEKLVQNIPTNHLAIIPADIPRDEITRKKLFAELSSSLAISYLELSEIYEQNRFSFSPVIVKKNISHDEEIKLIAEFHDISGILVRKDFKRDYAFSLENSHIFGYLGVIDEKTYEENKHLYTNDAFIGKMGLEAYYENTLRGEDGERSVLVDARGKIISEISFRQPKVGDNLTLTIDNELQKKVYLALAKGLKKAKSKAGVAIVLNPNNGEILAMVSIPAYDPNIFSKPVSVEEWNNLMADNNNPFLNRAISGVYPPGSVFKLTTATAVLENGIVGPFDKINSPDFIQIQDKFNPSVQYIYKDWKSAGNGMIDIRQALAVSSNTFFYQVAGGYQDFPGLGVSKLEEVYKRFKIGEPLGIDLPGEKKGFLNTPDLKLKETGASWYTGDTYNLAIGQGFLLLTPLQVANFTAMVANGGSEIFPHLALNKTVVQGGRKIFADEHLKIVREGLRMVVTDKLGTAQSFRSFPIEVAGKTGTAQFEKGKREHAWFTSFAPYDKPEVVVTVLLEESGEGSTFAVPVGRDILASYFKL